MSQTNNYPKDWQEVKLKDVCEIKMGQSPKSKTYNTNKLGVPLLNGAIELTSKGIKIHQYTSKPIKVSKKGDLLFCIRATIGNLNYGDKEYCLGRGVAAITPNKEKISQKYLYQLMDSIFDFLKLISVGSIIKGIKKDELRNITIFLPPFSEQTVIAQILTTVDNTIQKTDELIKQTETLKRGLMSELLTKGIGHNKFKQTELGEIPIEWEIKKIKDFAKVVTGKTPPTNNLENYGAAYLFVSPVDIGASVFINNTKKKVSEKGFKINPFVPKDSVLFVSIGSTIGKITIAGKDLTTNQQINSILPNKGCDTHFLYYFLQLHKDRIIAPSGKQAVPILKKSLFESNKVALPPLPEQHQISEILSTSDKEIEQLKTKKDYYTKLKKGLMQDLLTGKVRVKL